MSATSASHDRFDELAWWYTNRVARASSRTGRCRRRSMCCAPDSCRRVRRPAPQSAWTALTRQEPHSFQRSNGIPDVHHRPKLCGLRASSFCECVVTHEIRFLPERSKSEYRATLVRERHSLVRLGGCEGTCRHQGVSVAGQRASIRRSTLRCPLGLSAQPDSLAAQTVVSRLAITRSVVGPMGVKTGRAG